MNSPPIPSRPDAAADASEVASLVRRATAALGEGRIDEAAASTRRAIELAPNEPSLHLMLGDLLVRGRRHVEALASCDRAVSLAPTLAIAHAERARALGLLGRSAEALAALDRGLELDSTDATIHFRRGALLHGAGRNAEALASFGRAVELRPGFADAEYNRAVVLYERGARDEAMAGFRAAMAARPRWAAPRWGLAAAAIPLVAVSDEEVASSRREFELRVAELDRWLEQEGDDAWRLVAAIPPGYLAYQEEDNRALLAAYGATTVRAMQRWPGGKAMRRPAHRGPVRVGIVSTNVRDHSIWDAMLRGWIAYLDPALVELHVFKPGSREDAQTQWARERVRSLETGKRSLAEWVDAIAAREPDVLLYPETNVDAIVDRLAALRLAPVQVTTWGFPQTSGLPTIDYYLSADAFEPAGAQAHYTETLRTLPRLGCAYVPRAVVIDDAPAPRSPDAAAPLLLCAGTPFKYAPRYDSVLVAVARRLPEARLVFFEYAEPQLTDRFRRRLAAAFARDGLDLAAHASFVPWRSSTEFHALMRRATALLDTIGFSGFNTVMQAVASGLPVVTCEGRFMRGRFGSGILRQLGLSDLVAADPSEYVEIAARVATERPWRDEIARHIVERRETLYDDAGTVGALQEFLVEVTRGR